MKVPSGMRTVPPARISQCRTPHCRMDKTADQLEEAELLECLHRVAAKLKRNEWKILAVRLGLSKADVDDIVTAHPGDYSRQKNEMLLLWRRNFREYATPEKLMRALGGIVGKSGRERNAEGTKHSNEKPSHSTSTVRQGESRPLANQPTKSSSSHGFLSAVQIKGVPLPLQGREAPTRNLWRSETSSVSARQSTSRASKDSNWRGAVSAPPKKHGKITIEVDIQRIASSHSQRNHHNNGVQSKRSVNSDINPVTNRLGSGHTIDTTAPPRVQVARQPKVKCSCSIHRRRDEEGTSFGDEGERSSNKDPFDNLLKSLRDPFFRNLIEGSSEIDTAVDHLERMKGVFVDETKLKCALFVCRCTNIIGLDTLWEEYLNGDLAAMFQTSLVTDQSLASVGACGITLTTKLCEVEYLRCRELLLGTTGREDPHVPNDDKPRDLTALVVNTLFTKLYRGNMDTVSKTETPIERAPALESLHDNGKRENDVGFCVRGFAGSV